jgi:KUP system potassium uptake protein
LLSYIGQAAYISQDATGTAYTNPFFNTVPPGTFYFSLVIAILAAIVASQAMITGSFQLLSQVMRMRYGDSLCLSSFFYVLDGYTRIIGDYL